MAFASEPLRAVCWEKWVSFLFREELIQEARASKTADIHLAKVSLFMLPNRVCPDLLFLSSAPGAGPICPEEAYQIVWQPPK